MLRMASPDETEPITVCPFLSSHSPRAERMKAGQAEYYPRASASHQAVSRRPTKFDKTGWVIRQKCRTPERSKSSARGRCVDTGSVRLEPDQDQDRSA